MTCGLALVAWMGWNLQAHGVRSADLASDARVRVVLSDDAFVFTPASVARGAAALVYLPGGGVDPRAYVPQVRAVAERGFPSAIVRVPWRLAITDTHRATVWHRIEVVRALWGSARPLVIAGHSRGGATASWLAARHPMQIAGLVLVGTTHPRDDDLSQVPFNVVRISAEHDCVAPAARARQNAAMVPSDAVWVDVPGGNHAQFGHYGSQINDCRATTSREAQQAIVTKTLVDVLGAVSLAVP